jgi:hypothetical protein
MKCVCLLLHLASTKRLVILVCGIFSWGGVLNFALWTLMNLICFFTYWHGFEVLSRHFQKWVDRNNLMFYILACRNCLVFDVIEIYKKFLVWFKSIKNLFDAIVNIYLLGMQTNHVYIHYFYGLKLNGGIMMRYGLWLILLVVINFISLWTS